MITKFGREARIARTDKGVTMTEMAEYLGIKLSYLSAVENGKKPISTDIINKTYKFFKNLGITKKQWNEWAELSINQLKLNLDDYSLDERALTHSFHQRFKKLSVEDKKRIKAILDEYST